MGVLINLNTSCAALSGGAAAAAGTGEDWRLAIAGAWATGDEVTVTLTDAHTGLQTQIGAGNISGVAGTYCLTFSNKVYMLGGATAYFCELGAPTLWNDPNGSGNGFITMSNYFATPESLVACQPYQGRLAFASRRNVQIWQTDPDPANYLLVQLLANIGTVAAESMKAVGDMDVYMLADNGFRSIRVRDASNNAIIADIGTPIDAIVQPLLASLTDAQKAAACGVVDPSSNRYWCYIPTPGGAPGLIYVFSYFPSSGIAAWTTYSPTYETVTAPNVNAYTWNALVPGQTYVWTPGANESAFSCGATTFTAGQGGSFVCGNANAVATLVNAGNPMDGTLTLITPFVPTRFAVFDGQVWLRDTNGNIYQYGGANNGTYSACGVSAIAPYLNCDAPATRKYFRAIDAAFEGNWAINLSTDFIANTYSLVYSNNQSSFQRGRVPMNRYGTHYSFDFEEWGTGYALFSGAAMHFEPGDEK